MGQVNQVCDVVKVYYNEVDRWRVAGVVCVCVCVVLCWTVCVCVFLYNHVVVTQIIFQYGVCSVVVTFFHVLVSLWCGDHDGVVGVVTLDCLLRAAFWCV